MCDEGSEFKLKKSNLSRRVAKMADRERREKMRGKRETVIRCVSVCVCLCLCVSVCVCV